MVFVGIIGAGFMGTTHAKAYTENQHACVSIVADSNYEQAKTLADKVGARAVSNAQVILEDSIIDVVDIAVPTPYHSVLVINALRFGKHVVVEKPLALSMEEVSNILDVAATSGKYLMVGHVLRFWPEYIAIHDFLQSGKLGRPLYASAQRLSNLPQWASWFQDGASTGGVTLDLQIHDLDVLNWLFGKPKKVFATGVNRGTAGWLHATTQLTYEDMQASSEASFLMPRDFPFTAGLRILCEKGVIEYYFRAGGASFDEGEPTHYLVTHEPGKPALPLTFQEWDAFEQEIAYFVDCVNEGRSPETITPADAQLAVQVALAARESLNSGQPVLLDS